MTVQSYNEWVSCVPGDSLLVSGGSESANDMKFSTPDRDNDMSSGHCAEDWESGVIYCDLLLQLAHGSIEHL